VDFRVRKIEFLSLNISIGDHELENACAGAHAKSKTEAVELLL
jgi:hypothetical protein